MTSGHNPVVTKVDLKVKKLINGKPKQKLNYYSLKDSVVRQEVGESMREKMETVTQQKNCLKEKIR